MFKKRKSMKLQMFGRCNNSASVYVVKEDKSSIVPDKVRRQERRTCASFGSVFLDSRGFVCSFCRVVSLSLSLSLPAFAPCAVCRAWK